ncbi:PEGA domain-containing protein [Salinibacter altiplanensis]|uniref:PEGA domain-containing protein n=1 Tax=Salinibacter altiplanensis TaxID=1803181 RepID=UPI000C9F1D53|nr:PEGA domain-containing protein [Salinibacter altiplanensis]
MKNQSSLVGVLVLALAVAGCATIITGTTTDVAVSSDPSEAEIEINGMDRGETPTTLSLDSDRSYTMEISLDGYETESVQLRKSTSGWVAGNLLFGGLPGLIVDAATGGLYVLSPEQVNTSLEQGTASSGQLQIRVAMEVDTDGMTKIGDMSPLSE